MNLGHCALLTPEIGLEMGRFDGLREEVRRGTGIHHAHKYFRTLFKARSASYSATDPCCGGLELADPASQRLAWLGDP
jgi:hypothetical protein